MAGSCGVKDLELTAGDVARRIIDMTDPVYYGGKYYLYKPELNGYEQVDIRRFESGIFKCSYQIKKKLQRFLDFTETRTGR